jgi:hypothetical protein
MEIGRSTLMGVIAECPVIAGCKIQDAVCRMQDARFRMLDTG